MAEKHGQDARATSAVVGGVPVIMPNMDLIITEATIVGWFKKIGERVGKGEALLEIETDKAVTQIESPADGVLAEILADKGAVVPLGPATGDHHAMKTNPRIPASPRARRAMRQRGIDAATIKGTGPNGRIVEADVLRAASRSAGVSPAQTAQAGETPALPTGTISSMRRAVAAKVAESFATVPHFYLRSEVDATLLVQLREQNLAAIEKSCGVRPSVTDFLLRAMALALRDCPQANRIWQNDAIVQLPTVDVGLVIQSGDGLMVPVIQNADRLGLMDMARQRVRLTEIVRSGKTPADLFHGGATSLTNLGRRRVDQFAAIISPPQSSMLAVGRLAERPAVHEGRLCVRQTMNLTLSVDHRVMDGVPAAEFFDRIVELLETPLLLLCDMCAT